mmetsp:Transcript_22443/g.28325  ORF Transcript_22443/g.28325 Transcript_22443/m.28325 type:complete len:116 (+) Transcript_22443:50-397(+)
MKTTLLIVVALAVICQLVSCEATGDYENIVGSLDVERKTRTRSPGKSSKKHGKKTASPAMSGLRKSDKKYEDDDDDKHKRHSKKYDDDDDDKHSKKKSGKGSKRNKFATNYEAVW